MDVRRISQGYLSTKDNESMRYLIFTSLLKVYLLHGIISVCARIQIAFHLRFFSKKKKTLHNVIVFVHSSVEYFK